MCPHIQLYGQFIVKYNDDDDDDDDDDDYDDDDDDDLSDESEEGGGKVDGTILIYWLVHPYKH